MPPPKPACGSQGPSTDDDFKIILAIFGALGTVAGVVTTFIPQLQAALNGSAPPLSFAGVTAPGVIWITAGVSAAATWFAMWGFYYSRCLRDPDGPQGCSSGVVNTIVPSFNSATDELFPFTAMHDRVDVVVKSSYWPLVQLNALFVKCNSDPDSSPMFLCFYHNDNVCLAGLGSIIGGAVGGFAGTLLGALAGAAIGCATLILCLLALLIAALIAIATTLVGALAGGQIARALFGRTSAPSVDWGGLVEVKQYITTKGKLITDGNSDGARVYWFVNHTMAHGDSNGSPPFSYKDPDANLPLDGCLTGPI